MKYELQFNKHFNTIMETYSLRSIVLSEEKIALVGSDYLLVFLFHFDDVTLLLIKRDSENQLQKWNIDNYISSSLDAMDREDIQQGNTVKENIENILIVLSRGLKNHWNNLLCGEKNWLNTYQKSKYVCSPRNLSPEEYDYASRVI